MPLSPGHRSRLRQDFQSNDEERLNMTIPTDNSSKGIETQSPLYSSRRPPSPMHRHRNSSTQNSASGMIKETFSDRSGSRGSSSLRGISTCKCGNMFEDATVDVGKRRHVIEGMNLSSDSGYLLSTCEECFIEGTIQRQHAPVKSPDFDQRSFVKRRDAQEDQRQLHDTSEFMNRVSASHGEDRMESSSKRENMSDDHRDIDNASFDSFLLHDKAAVDDDFAGLEARYIGSTIHDEFASLEARYNESSDGFVVQEAQQDGRRTIDDEFAGLEARSNNTSQPVEFGGLEARYIGSTVDDEFAALEASCSRYDSYDDSNHRGNVRTENEPYRANVIVSHGEKIIHGNNRTEPEHKLESKPNSLQDEDTFGSRKAGLLAQPETATDDIKPHLLQRHVDIAKQQKNGDNQMRGRSWELDSNFSEEDPIASDFDLRIVHKENEKTRRELPASSTVYKNESQIQYEKDIISLNAPNKVNGKMFELPRTPRDEKRSQFATSPMGRRVSDDDDDDDRFKNDTTGPSFIRRHSFRNSLDSAQMQSIMDLSTGSDSEETDEKEEDKESASSHSGPTNANTSFLENNLSSRPLSSADRRAIANTYLNAEDRLAADNSLCSNNVYYGEQNVDQTSFGTSQNHVDIAKTYINAEDRFAADNNLSSNDVYGEHHYERTSMTPQNHVSDVNLSTSVSNSTELDELRTEAEMTDRQEQVRKLVTEVREERKEKKDLYSCIELVFHCKLCCG